MKNIQEMLDILAEQNCKIEKTKYGAIIITPSVKREPEEPKFKDGDFVYYSEVYNGKKFDYVFIFKSVNGKEIKQHLSISKDDKCQSVVLRRAVFNNEGLNDRYRLATGEEKQTLLNALYYERKIWNPETLQIEEDRAPRVGDKCVYLEEGIKSVIVSVLKDSYKGDEGQMIYETSDGYQHLECVRLQDFDFDTMKPKP